MSGTKHSQTEPVADETARRWNRRRVRIFILAVLTALLFGLLFVQSAFNTLDWFRPTSVGETFSLYVLSTINFLAFIVLLMVLVRNVIKLRRERRQKKLGSKFKTRLVVFFIALSLLPVTFLFFVTTGLINRSIEKWFSLPGDEMLTNALYIQSSYVDGEKARLYRTARTLSRIVSNASDDQLENVLATELATQELMLIQIYDKNGHLLAHRSSRDWNKAGPKFREALQQVKTKVSTGEPYEVEVEGEGSRAIYLISGTPIEKRPGGAFLIAEQVPRNFSESVNKIKELEASYESLKKNIKWYRSTALQTLALITLLVLFIAFWLGLHTARGIADPVQKLAEATERVKMGDLSYRAVVVGDDELAALAQSFNEMTAELAENRRRLEDSAEEQKMSNAALDERRRYIETILQSLSAGVISLDERANVTTINDAALKLLKIDDAPDEGVALETLLPEEQREELRKMILRAARQRSTTREVHFTLSNQTKLDAAVTVTALHGPDGQPRGAVIVIEDLTELIEAQRRAAWSEVARRMAHEIKNPLTPIRLSAERLSKKLLTDSNGSNDSLDEKQAGLVRECTSMIDAEVATLQRMVDEFSNFARLPTPNLETASLNDVVNSTIKLYEDRLNGIRLTAGLAENLPPVSIDREQIKRVLVNLIDNAANALALSNGDRSIIVSTRELIEREAVELVVADTGPGIPPEDRERIFDPYFSTSKRGTGLGLAIVSRIIAEHQGRIRVQGNLPSGARFIVELPMEKS